MFLETQPLNSPVRLGGNRGMSEELFAGIDIPQCIGTMVRPTRSGRYRKRTIPVHHSGTFVLMPQVEPYLSVRL